MAGVAHSLALTDDGEVDGWGWNNYGQLGLGYTSESFEPGTGQLETQVFEPVHIQHLPKSLIEHIYCGSTFSLFQTKYGELYGCGMNDLG